MSSVRSILNTSLILRIKNGLNYNLGQTLSNIPSSPHASNGKIVIYPKHSLIKPSHIPITKLTDDPVIRYPGQTIPMAQLIRNFPFVPPMGFNSIIRINVEKFEALDENWEVFNGKLEPLGNLDLPSDIFNTILRRDLMYNAVRYYRFAMAGFDSQFEFGRDEVPFSGKKLRDQIRPTGKARLGVRKATGKYEGLKAWPARMKDWRLKEPKHILWWTLKMALTAKVSQAQLHVVDHLSISSPSSELLRGLVKRLVGDRCTGVLFIHADDINDEFVFAQTHLPLTERATYKYVNVYKLLQYSHCIITVAGLEQLVKAIKEYPEKQGWTWRSATPDGNPAPVPPEVPGWRDAFDILQERRRVSENRAKVLMDEMRKIKWSREISGPLKRPIWDELRGMRLSPVGLHDPIKSWQNLWEIEGLQFQNIKEKSLDDNKVIEQLLNKLDDYN